MEPSRCLLRSFFDSVKAVINNFSVPFGKALPILRVSLMAMIRPFAALRPEPRLADKICELPYDVMSSEEARQMAAGNPLSFLHVSKPEIDLPPGTDIYAPDVYTKGKDNFQRLVSQGALKQDSQRCFYLYRQIMGGHSQVGLVATASCEEYLKGTSKNTSSPARTRRMIASGTSKHSIPRRDRYS